MSQEPKVDPYAELKAKMHREYEERVKKMEEFKQRRKQPIPQQMKEEATQNTGNTPTTQDPNLSPMYHELQKIMKRKLMKGVHLRKRYHRKYKHNHHKDDVDEIK